MRGCVGFHSDMTSPRFAIICGCLLAWAAPLLADTLVLKNGRSLEGIISRETDTHISLELGVGSVTMARNTISTVTRASEQENRQIRTGWKRSFFLHKDYVPPGLETLAADFMRLKGQRDAAIQARQALARARTDEFRLGVEKEQLQQQMVEISRRLQAVIPEKNRVEYNGLVMTNNNLIAQLTVKRDELENTRKSHQSSEETMAAYLDALPVFERALTNRLTVGKGDPAETEDRRYFFDRIAETLKAFDSEFLTATVDVSRSRSGTIVSVLVNEAIQGKFILDTGAGMVTISEAFARRLKLDPDRLPVMDFVMADGRKVAGKSALLNSMKLGNARAENIETAVLPVVSGDGIDGLLGMSFLRHFAVHLEGASGTLTLRQFTPK